MNEAADHSFILVQTTSNSVEVLKKIARLLVEKRLAACVQIGGPLESYFRWEGKTDSAKEWLCSIKTTKETWPQVREAIQELHNYDTPEIIVLPIVDGSDSYLKWVRDNVANPDG